MDCPNSTTFDQCYKDKLKIDLDAFNASLQCFNQGCLNKCFDTTATACTFENVVQPKFDALSKTIDTILGITKPPTVPPYDATSANQLKSQYDKMLALRKSIDEQLKQISETSDGKPSIPNLYKQNLDIVMVMNTLWATLAITLAYYVFMRIRD